MKKLIALIVVAVLATAMVMAGAPGNYNNNSTAGASIEIYGTVNSVPLVITPQYAQISLDGVNPGEFIDYSDGAKRVDFTGTCAKGYGLKITGTIDFKFVLPGGALDSKISTSGCYSVEGGTWSAWTPITNADGTYIVSIPGASTVAGKAYIAFCVTKFEVGSGAPVGQRIFTASVTAEYYEN